MKKNVGILKHSSMIKKIWIESEENLDWGLKKILKFNLQEEPNLNRLK